MQTLCVVARIRARKDKQEELEGVLSALVEPTRKESGCIRYQLYRNNQDPQDFAFIEEWADNAALERHLQTPHLRSAAAAFSLLAEGESFIGRYSLIA